MYVSNSRRTDLYMLRNTSSSSSVSQWAGSMLISNSTGLRYIAHSPGWMCANMRRACGFHVHHRLYASSRSPETSLGNSMSAIDVERNLKGALSMGFQARLSMLFGQALKNQRG